MQLICLKHIYFIALRAHKAVPAQEILEAGGLVLLWMALEILVLPMKHVIRIQIETKIVPDVVLTGKVG